MGHYSDLPTELRLQIMSYLSSRDLAALARVNKAQVEVAREQLYTAPEIDRPDEGNRLMSLLRTLFAHPQLIGNIRSLSLAPVECSVPLCPRYTADDTEWYRTYWDGSNYIFRCSEYCLIQKILLERLHVLSVTAQSSCGWIAGIMNWRTPAFYGGLLALLPNFKQLSIECHVKTPGQLFPNVFFGLLANNHLEPTACALIKLQDITSTGGHISPQLLQWPSLRCLRLNSTSRFRPTFFPRAATCNLTHLEITLTFEQLYRSSPWDFALGSSLNALTPSLKHIKLFFETWDPLRGKPTVIRHGAFTAIIRDLQKFSPNTETLVMQPCRDYHSRLHVYDPIPSLVPLVHPRKVGIPYEPAQDNLPNILPPGIEELTLWCTSYVTPAAIQDVIAYQVRHNSLRRLDVYCQRSDMWTRDHPFWEGFKSRGISVYTWAFSGNLLLKGRPA